AGRRSRLRREEGLLRTAGLRSRREAGHSLPRAAVRNLQAAHSCPKGSRIAPLPASALRPHLTSSSKCFYPAAWLRCRAVPLRLPLGSNEIAAWAHRARLGYEPHPDEDWFRRWEPHDAIAPPGVFFNSCTWMAAPDPGHVVVVEPWYAPEDT